MPSMNSKRYINLYIYIFNSNIFGTFLIVFLLRLKFFIIPLKIINWNSRPLIISSANFYCIGHFLLRRTFFIASAFLYCVGHFLLHRPFFIASDIFYCIGVSLLRRTFFIVSAIFYCVGHFLLYRPFHIASTIFYCSVNVYYFHSR